MARERDGGEGLATAWAGSGGQAGQGQQEEQLKKRGRQEHGDCSLQYN